MGFDFSNASGEQFGDIEGVFFSDKNGKNFVDPESSGDGKVDLQKLNQSIADKTEAIAKTHSTTTHGTVINISKDIIGTDEDMKVILTEQEERRMNTTSVKNKEYINLNDGSVITVIEKTEMYNGTNLYTVKDESGKMITYPRSMFLGRTKQFVPKDYYIREAERALEDSIDKFYMNIMEMIKNNRSLAETSDSKYIELLLETPINIIGDMVVPDKIQIPVKRMFDLEYKILMLENVICLDNKIASLLFQDIWF